MIWEQYSYSKQDVNANTNLIHDGKNLCNMISDYKGSKLCHLNRHIEFVHRKTNPFKCGICDNFFDTRHNNVHEKNKPITCQICGLNCSQEVNWDCIFIRSWKKGPFKSEFFDHRLLFCRGYFEKAYAISSWKEEAFQM